jgi:hypothetical protein
MCFAKPLCRSSWWRRIGRGGAERVRQPRSRLPEGGSLVPHPPHRMLFYVRAHAIGSAAPSNPNDRLQVSPPVLSYRLALEERERLKKENTLEYNSSLSRFPL